MSLLPPANCLRLSFMTILSLVGRAFGVCGIKATAFFYENPMRTNLKLHFTDGFEACDKCGQDHHAALVCIGRKLGNAPKNPATQRAIALKRWADWRAKKETQHENQI